MKTSRNNRIRIIQKDCEKGAIYHCVSRTINKEFWWDEKAKEIMRRQLWKVAAFCGVDILAYCLMSNHFHVLVRVVTGRSASLSNRELSEKLRNFYTNPDDQQLLARLQADLASPEPRIQEATRKMLLARMDDLSNFMKIFKQRFSIWYNRNHNRCGPHWNDRFQSVLVEDCPSALRLVAAYLALNPVRAGICSDPKNYRYSSYTEALVGNRKALEGLCEITGEHDGRTALEKFRQFVYAVGEKPKADGSGMVIDGAEGQKVRQEGGQLPWASILYSKARFYTQGVAIGTADYLDALLRSGVVRPTRKTRRRPIAEQVDKQWHTFRN